MVIDGHVFFESTLFQTVSMNFSDGSVQKPKEERVASWSKLDKPVKEQYCWLGAGCWMLEKQFCWLRAGALVGAMVSPDVSTVTTNKL